MSTPRPGSRRPQSSQSQQNRQQPPSRRTGAAPQPQAGGQLPPRVYRNRRIGALVVLGLVIWGIWSGIASLVAGSASAGNPSAQPTTPTVAGAGEACAPGAVTVTAHIGTQAAADKQAFDKGEMPYVWFTLKNSGSVDCSFNAGSNRQYYTITSGAETIWTSKDCDRSNDVEQSVTIAAGTEINSPASQWDRVYSAGGGAGSGCSAKDGQTAVTGGGASYHLTVEVGGVLSANDVQFVLY